MVVLSRKKAIPKLHEWNKNYSPVLFCGFWDTYTCTLKNLSKVADNIVVDDDTGEITTNDDMGEYLYQDTLSKMLNNIKNIYNSAYVLEPVGIL